MIKILLVEDDKIIVASLSEYLNSEGYLRSASNDGTHGSILVWFRGLPVEGAGGYRDFI